MNIHKNYYFFNVVELFPFSYLKSKKDSLQESVRHLQARSRALENALRDAHGHISSSPHPLLQDKVTSVTGIHQHNGIDSSQKDVKDEVDDLQDAFGSLVIGDEGQTRYTGPSSSVEVSL